MLHAITQNMAGSSVNFCEDTLTSSVFGQLLYLPTELMWEILRQSAYATSLPRGCGRIEFVEFWPKWDCTGTNNSFFVEPDLFIRFTEFDLVIEAKRWEDRTQSRSQWETEIRAYQNENAADNRLLHFLAVGGLHSEASEQVTVNGIEYEVVMCRWSRILRAVKQALHQLERCTYSTTIQQAHMRVLADLVSYFGLHGYATGAWLEDAELSQWRLNSYVTVPQLKFEADG